jgi:hypothetical protein
LAISLLINSVLWIRIGLHADLDPDPAFISGSQNNADPDPDPDQTFESQKVKFLHEKFT